MNWNEQGGEAKMTVEEYYAAVRQLGLRPSRAKDVYLDRSNEPYNVPDATRKTPEERAEILEILRGIVSG